VKISIITVCRNAAATIEETIRSVASQDYSVREHIVIDGDSRDGTQAILERHRAALDFCVSEPDNGIYDAMNKGIARATGDVVGFLNADDCYMHDGVLSRIAAQFAVPDTDACYADLVYVDARDPGRVVRYWKSRQYTDGLFEKGWMPAHPTFYAQRKAYQRFGGYDTRYRLQADFELTMRFLACRHIRATYVPEVWVRMRPGGVSNASLRNVVQGNLEAYHAARKNGLAVTPLFMLRKVLSRVPQFFSRPA
jgi:glycosyltransferase involved in cell wall biosynthesis